MADPSDQDRHPKPAEPRSFKRQRGDRSKQAATKPRGDGDQPSEADAHVDKQLDHGLKETFPASDPVSINPGSD